MAEWWQTQRKIATLPGPVTPDVALARTLEKARAKVTNEDGSKQPTVAGVYIAIRWWDDAYAFDYSTMPLTELLMHREMLDRVIAAEIRKRGDFEV